MQMTGEKDVTLMGSLTGSFTQRAYTSSPKDFSSRGLS
jgi:hypothetical protein